MNGNCLVGRFSPSVAFERIQNERLGINTREDYKM
jgi:hypothetical protein